MPKVVEDIVNQFEKKGMRVPEKKTVSKIEEDKIPDWIQLTEKESYEGFKYRTPSQSPFPVFVMCQPMYVDTKIANNAWMKGLNGKAKEIDKERFMGEWYNFYILMSADSCIYLLPPKKGLQDQVYVNCFAYLPHITERDVIVLSNFTAEGRPGEETIAGELLKNLGYEVHKCPHKFEGEPELKFLKEDIYFGGYGIRTKFEALQWIEEKFKCNIIPVHEKDEKLYHLDCSVFVLDEENVMVGTELIDKATMKKIEKVANVHSVTKEACHESICNSVRVGDLILTSSSLQFLQKRDPEYKKEWKKDRRMEQICRNLGLSLMFIEMSEAAKSGAALSCFVSHLNYRY